MIKAEVVFEDDYITLNGKDVWLECESMNFAVGDHDADLIIELFPSQELAIRHCMEPTNESK